MREKHSTSGKVRVLPSHERSPKVTAQTYDAKLEELARKIEKKDGASSALDCLEKSGVPRKAVLRLLAITVTAGSGRELFDDMRNQQDKLNSLGGRLKTLGTELKEALENPFMNVKWWAYLPGQFASLGMPLPRTWGEDPGVELTCDGMLILAKFFHDEAQKFGKFLRSYGRRDSQEKIGLLLVHVLLFQAQKSPIEKPDQLDSLANLLTDAIEVAEVNKYGEPWQKVGQPKKDNEYYTVDGLRKVWETTGKRLLSLCLAFNRPKFGLPAWLNLQPNEPQTLPETPPMGIIGKISDIPTKLQHPQRKSRRRPGNRSK